MSGLPEAVTVGGEQRVVADARPCFLSLDEPRTLACIPPRAVAVVLILRDGMGCLALLAVLQFLKYPLECTMKRVLTL